MKVPAGIACKKLIWNTTQRYGSKEPHIASSGYSRLICILTQGNIFGASVLQYVFSTQWFFGTVICLGLQCPPIDCSWADCGVLTEFYTCVRYNVLYLNGRPFEKLSGRVWK